MRPSSENTTSTGTRSPSVLPSASATARLLVATAGNPAAATVLADATSHTLGSTSGRPGWWSASSRAAPSVKGPRVRSSTQPVPGVDDRDAPDQVGQLLLAEVLGDLGKELVADRVVGQPGHRL